jgi:hypothetical protein
MIQGAYITDAVFSAAQLELRQCERLAFQFRLPSLSANAIDVNETMSSLPPRKRTWDARAGSGFDYTIQ